MDVALNWLWQGVLVAGATALILRVIPPTNPQARYRLLWAALLSLYLLPVVAIGLAVAVTDLDATMPAVTPAALVSLPAAVVDIGCRGAHGLGRLGPRDRGAVAALARRPAKGLAHQRAAADRRSGAAATLDLRPRDRPTGAAWRLRGGAGGSGARGCAAGHCDRAVAGLDAV